MNITPGCSKRPDFSPTQPRRAKTRRSAGKAQGRRYFCNVSRICGTPLPVGWSEGLCLIATCVRLAYTFHIHR